MSLLVNVLQRTNFLCTFRNRDTHVAFHFLDTHFYDVKRLFANKTFYLYTTSIGTSNSTTYYRLAGRQHSHMLCSYNSVSNKEVANLSKCKFNVDRLLDTFIWLVRKGLQTNVELKLEYVLNTKQIIKYARMDHDPSYIAKN